HTIAVYASRPPSPAGHATLATGRVLALTRTGLAPAGSDQLILTHPPLLRQSHLEMPSPLTCEPARSSRPDGWTARALPGHRRLLWSVCRPSSVLPAAYRGHHRQSTTAGTPLCIHVTGKGSLRPYRLRYPEARIRSVRRRDATP